MRHECLYHYVMNQNSVTHTYYKNKWENMKKLFLAIDTFFNGVKDYDFQKQIDLCLLYIVYHCIGNIKNSGESNKRKRKKVMDILKDQHVVNMFKRLKINTLDVSWKLKLITYSYKYKFFLVL